MGTAQLARAADECILCCEAWQRDSSQINYFWGELVENTEVTK